MKICERLDYCVNIQSISLIFPKGAPTFLDYFRFWYLHIWGPASQQSKTLRLKKIGVKKVWKKTKKNQKIVNSEISSKTLLLQTSKKLTKSLLLQTSKNRRNRWKKSCSKFFDKFKIFYFFRVFVRKCLQKASKGQRNN